MQDTDLILSAQRIPGTQLVHLAAGDRCHVVLDRFEAARLGRELIAVAGLRHVRGRADAAGGHAAMSRSAARPS